MPINTSVISNTSGRATIWWELSLLIPDLLADDAAALLVEAGVEGVEMRSTEFTPPPVANLEGASNAAVEKLLKTHLKESKLPHGFTMIIASSSEGTHINSHQADTGSHLLAQCFEGLQQIGLSHLLDGKIPLKRQDEEWHTRWRTFFSPLKLGKQFWIVPLWDRHTFVPPAGSIPLFIDPGMAFGTGQHATTALCASALETLLNKKLVDTMLDVGSGSGVLSLVAAKLGVKHITAIDTDPLAAQATLDNWQENNLTKELQLDSSITGISDIASGNQPYSLVVANILAHILIDMAPQLLSTLDIKSAEGGQLLLSGILDSQEKNICKHFIEEAKKLGFMLTLASRSQEKDWVALLFHAHISCTQS